MNQPGINVIGHVAATLGVGVVTRQVIELVEALGHPVAAFDVDTGTRRARDDRRFDRISCTTAEDLPHRINLFVLGLGALDWTLNKCPERFFDGSHVNAVVCFWELPVVPRRRLAQLDQMDIAIGASGYIRHVFQQSLSQATTLEAKVPIVLPERVPFQRAGLGIPASATTFVFSFDPASDPERKNPAAAVKAFVRGAGADESAWLVIKINNAADAAGREHPSLIDMRALVASHPRIVLLTVPMTYAEVLGLYEACDVYLSLHRAEGLGLGMAEAMLLGKAVIATGWSGNTAFMRQSNACLVDYTMVPVRGTLAAYREDRLMGKARWAEPSIEHAAACIEYLCNNVEARRAIGRIAAEDMAAFNREAQAGGFIKELVAFQEQREAFGELGYARSNRRGRPLLEPSSPSWTERTTDAATDFARRVERKMIKWRVLDDRKHRASRKRTGSS